MNGSLRPLYNSFRLKVIAAQPRFEGKNAKLFQCFFLFFRLERATVEESTAIHNLSVNRRGKEDRPDKEGSKSGSHILSHHTHISMKSTVPRHCRTRFQPSGVHTVHVVSKLKHHELLKKGDRLFIRPKCEVNYEDNRLMGRGGQCMLTGTRGQRDRAQLQRDMQRHFKKTP